jgi:hypothetical protein
MDKQKNKKPDFTDVLIDAVVKKLSEEETKAKINDQLVTPLIENISSKVQPYIYTMTIAYSLILIPVILMLILIIFGKSKK